MNKGLLILADENLDYDILRGVIRRLPHADIVRIQDIGLSGSADPAVLEYAAQSGRVLLTHDVNAMTRFALDRIESGMVMTGVFVIPQSVPIGRAIDEIVLLIECSISGEWEGQIQQIPL